MPRKPKPETVAPETVADVAAMVPLSMLSISPLNAREAEPYAEDIAILADSIRACGLMQNLMGHQTGPDAIGIVAGGRRLRALQMIASGSDQPDPMVPVRITTDESMARIWAAAENTGRIALAPADEIRAYGRMAQSGASPATIARAFAVTERHVAQRLRLASLSQPVMDALRARRISLDQAAALTTARNPEAAEEVLQLVLRSNWEFSAAEIRRRLQGGSVPATDRRAVFVGLDRYLAAGGEVQTDLLTDHTRLLDEDLLHDLFTQRLMEAVADEGIARGWSDVRHFTDAYIDYSAASGMDALHRVPVDLPEGDAEELDELLRLGEMDELTDAQADRLDELQARAAGDYSAEDIATGILWLYVDREGRLQQFGPYRPRVAKPEQADGTAGVTPGESRAMPESLRTDLSRIRLAALQLDLMDCPDLMADLLGYALDTGFSAWASPLAISVTRQVIQPEKPDGTALPERLTRQDGTRIGQPSFEGFTEWRQQPLTVRRAALALGLARAFTGHSSIAPHLAATLKSNPRLIWTPTGPGYLSRLPGPALDAIWAELVPADREPTPARFRALKKAEKAGHLHRLFNDSDFREAIGLSRAENAAIDAWLPAELQWPAVETDDAEAPETADDDTGDQSGDAAA